MRPLFLACGLDLDVQITKEPRGDWRGGFGHQAHSFCRFWEGNDITNTGCAAENCQQPVKPQCDAPMRGSAVTKSVQHITKTQPRFFGWDLQHFLKHNSLNVGLMNADGASAQL